MRDRHPDDIRLRKNQWVLFAYIIVNRGPQSLAGLSKTVETFKKVDNRPRSIATYLNSRKKKGFFILETYRTSENKYISVWDFNGELPEIREQTRKRWETNMAP
jgi:hypothetical protein